MNPSKILKLCRLQINLAFTSKAIDKPLQTCNVLSEYSKSMKSNQPQSH